MAKAGLENNCLDSRSDRYERLTTWVTWAGIAGVMVCLSAASIQADGKVESQMIDYDISIDGYRASSDRREDTGILMRRAVRQSDEPLIAARSKGSGRIAL